MKIFYLKLPYQTSYSIRTNCHKMADALKLKYGRYINEKNINADFTLSVLKADNFYKFFSSHEDFTTPFPLSEIDHFIFNSTTYSPHIFALHGAAVEYNGAAYLFLAPTTGGKTTLASYLTTTGFGYITDDCILLDRESFAVYPCTTPVHIRGGGLAVLEKYGAKPKNLQLLEEEPAVRYTYLPENCVTRETPLAKIFFIERTSSENRLIPMSANEKIAELMKSPITQYKIDAEYIRFLTRLASKDCFRLKYCDMNYVAEVIRNG